MNFNEIVLKTLDEGALSSRCKYQIGDIVAIRDRTGYFQRQVRKANRIYLNRIGTIDGDRINTGQQVMYSIKFPDGNVVHLPSQFIQGPIKNLKTARKYDNNSMPVGNEDLILSPSAIPLTDWQKKPLVEKKLKAIITTHPFNYIWFDEPKIEVKAGETIFTLAEHPHSTELNVKRTHTTQTLKLSNWNSYSITCISNNFFEQVLMTADIPSRITGMFRTSDLFEDLPRFNASYELASALASTLASTVTELLKRRHEKITLSSDFINYYIERYKAKGLQIFDYYIQSLRNMFTINLKLLETDDTLDGIPLSHLNVFPDKNNTLQGCPKIVDGDFYINTHRPFNLPKIPLTSLLGGPEYVKGNYFVGGELHSLEGVARHIDGKFSNPGGYTHQDYLDFLRVKGLKDVAQDDTSDDEGSIMDL